MHGYCPIARALVAASVVDETCMGADGGKICSVSSVMDAHGSSGAGDAEYAGDAAVAGAAHVCCPISRALVAASVIESPQELAVDGAGEAVVESAVQQPLNRRARRAAARAARPTAVGAVQPCAAAVQRIAGPARSDLPVALASAVASVAVRQREQVQARVAVALGERRLASMQDALSNMRAVFGVELDDGVLPAVQLVSGVVLTGGEQVAGGAEAKF